jgi:hypothetical protein
MTALSHIYMRIGSKDQGKSFKNFPFVLERSMCKFVVKGCLLQRIVFLRVSQVICTRIFKRCLESFSRISKTPCSTAPVCKTVNSFHILCVCVCVCVCNSGLPGFTA